MPSSGMLRRVAFSRIHVSEDRSASIIRVIRIGELGTTLAVPSNSRMQRIKCLVSGLVQLLVFETFLLLLRSKF
jgi:hypothetical protein